VFYSCTIHLLTAFSHVLHNKPVLSLEQMHIGDL